MFVKHKQLWEVSKMEITSCLRWKPSDLTLREGPNFPNVMNHRCSKYNVLSVGTSKIWYLGNFSKTCSKYLSVTIYRYHCGTVQCNHIQIFELTHQGPLAVKGSVTSTLLKRACPGPLESKCCMQVPTSKPKQIYSPEKLSYPPKINVWKMKLSVAMIPFLRTC